MIFVGCMAIVAIIGFSVTVKFMLDAGYDYVTIAVRSLDLITITVPPILPSAMAIGTFYS